MTNIELIHLNGGFVIECRGHAGFAGRGNDIVCAGVSALCAALLERMRTLSAENSVKIESCHIADGEFCLEISYPEDKASAITARSSLETVAEGLRAIAGEYPENVNFEEQ